MYLSGEVGLELFRSYVAVCMKQFIKIFYVLVLKAII